MLIVRVNFTLGLKLSGKNPVVILSRFPLPPNNELKEYSDFVIYFTTSYIKA